MHKNACMQAHICIDMYVCTYTYIYVHIHNKGSNNIKITNENIKIMYCYKLARYSFILQTL